MNQPNSAPSDDLKEVFLQFNVYIMCIYISLLCRH